MYRRFLISTSNILIVSHLHVQTRTHAPPLLIKLRVFQQSFVILYLKPENIISGRIDYKNCDVPQCQMLK